MGYNSYSDKSNYCAAVDGGSLDRGAAIILWECIGHINEMFELVTSAALTVEEQRTCCHVTPQPPDDAFLACQLYSGCCTMAQYIDYTINANDVTCCCTPTGNNV